MVFNMVRQGLFGEILHAEGGYLHDLRSIKFADRGEGLWRRAWASKVNGNLYPTHGLGPVANCMDINRGDRFDYLVSMSGPSRGLQDVGARPLSRRTRRSARRSSCSATSTSRLISTARGTHDLRQSRHQPAAAVQPHPPRPGHEGALPGLPEPGLRRGPEPRAPVGGRQGLPRASSTIPSGPISPKSAQGAGHGGMDYIEDYRLIKCLREGVPTDMNVYDAAALSAVVHLSQQSNARRSSAVDFPDFTRGKWQSTQPLGIVRA